MRPSRRRSLLRASARGRRLALLAIAGTLAPVAPTLAAPSVAPVLGTGTSITWTGTAGTLLSVPATTSLPRYGARLTVRGGTYAVVRLSPRGVCAPRVPRCPVEWFLDYTRTLAPVFAGEGPGGDHLARIGNGVLRPAVYEVYLLTDGTATLTFDSTSAPRTGRAHRARGRVDAALLPLPVTCSGPACGPEGYAGRVRVGGTTVNAGALGSVDFLVGSRSRNPSVPQAHGVRGCLSTTAPDTGAHPLGCDTLTTDPDGLAYAAVGTAELVARAPATSAALRADAAHLVRGPVYVGHQVFTAHDASDPIAVAYAVRLSYGVR